MALRPRALPITGCSTGFGRALAEELIGRRERVFATARKPEQVADIVKGHGNATAPKLAVTDAGDIAAAVAAAGKIGGVTAVRDKLARMDAGLDKWESVSLGADYPDAEQS